MAQQTRSRNLARCRWGAFVMAGALVGLSGLAWAQNEAMEIGNRKQLFIDDTLIAEVAGLVFHVHPPVKHGAVILPELPPENGRVGPYGSVLNHHGRLMMWYWAMERRDTEKGRRSMALAYSSDGYAWTKPELNVQERGGSKANNAVSAVGDTVALNPGGPEAEHFVLLQSLYWEDPDRGGMYLSFSADGIHWKPQGERLFPFSPDTQNVLLHDDRIGKWVAYLRLWDPDRRVGRVELDGLTEPWPYDGSKKPHFIWGEEHPPVPRWEIPTVFATDEGDPADSDVYTPIVVKYPWAEDVYLMFPSLYQHFPGPKEGGKYPNDGLLDIHLAVSRDGAAWHRPSRRPYLGLGEAREPDSKRLYMLAGMVRTEDTIHHYYSGYQSTHGEYASEPERHHDGSICHATQRLDGFVSLRAGAETGRFLTRPLVFDGSRLELNLTTAATGLCRVGLCDEGGAPFAGYALEDCETIRGNSVAWGVHWREHEDVSALVGKAIRLQVELTLGDLYALRFR